MVGLIVLLPYTLGDEVSAFKTSYLEIFHFYILTTDTYGGPVGRGYEQRFESKNEYEQRSESKIAYGPRAKLRTVREQNCVRSESKIAYGLRAKLRTVREQNCVWSESKNAQELRAKMRTS